MLSILVSTNKSAEIMPISKHVSHLSLVEQTTGPTPSQEIQTEQCFKRGIIHRIHIYSCFCVLSWSVLTNNLYAWTHLVWTSPKMFYSSFACFKHSFWHIMDNSRCRELQYMIQNVKNRMPFRLLKGRVAKGQWKVPELWRGRQLWLDCGERAGA